MSAETRDGVSPLPWRVDCDTNNNPRFPRVRDANGLNIIVSNDDTGRIRFADAALIVAAVNGLADALAHADDCARAAAAEHSARARDVEDAQREANARADRLRDLVRRLADALGTFAALEDHEMDLLREARDALGEAAP